MTVRVKKLEWEDSPARGWKRGRVQGYSPAGREAVIERTEHGWGCHGEHYTSNKYGSISRALKAAKAAAQADFERRILSVIEDDRDEVLEQAAREWAAAREATVSGEKATWERLANAESALAAATRAMKGGEG